MPVRPPEDSSLGPMRVYRAEARQSPIRRIHIRLALLTAMIAFVIATAVLTLPELVFGGAVTSHAKTTLFGGHKHKTKSTKQQDTTTQTAPATSTPSSSTTTPQPTTRPEHSAGPDRTADHHATPSTTPAPGAAVADARPPRRRPPP